MLKIGFHLPETERIASWKETAELCRIAEDVGFDSIWVPDHLLYRFEGEEPSGPWECWTMLSAIAAITSRVEIGPLVLCANFRNPALVAKMAATLDEISGGRLILGLGAGWHQPEYDGYGFDFDGRFGRFLEAFTIIHTLLTQHKIDFVGKHFTLRECELLPIGPRVEGPPLMIGSRGERVLAATLPHVQYWNGWFAWNGNTVEGYRPLHDQVDDAARKASVDPGKIKRTMAILLKYPHGTGPADPRAKIIQGDDHVLAEALLNLHAAGVDHIQVVLEPNKAADVERFGKVIEIVRTGLSSAH